MADQRCDRDHHRASKDDASLDRLEMELLIHHRVQPSVAVRGDGRNDAIEQIAGKSLGRVDLANLLPLNVRNGIDLGRFARPLCLVIVPYRNRRRVADGAHRNRFGDRGGKSGNEEDGVGAATGDHAEDDPENVDQPILPTQDHVAQPVRLSVLLGMPL